MLIRLLRYILKIDKELMLGRHVVFMMDGGWEVEGKVLNITFNYLSLEQESGVIEIRRNNIVGRHIGRIRPSEQSDLVGRVTQPYHIQEPVASAATAPRRQTSMEAQLAEASQGAEDIKREVNYNEEDERPVEVKSYGSIIPGGMLKDDDNNLGTYFRR